MIIQMVEGFCFVLSVTGLDKLSTGKDDEGDDNNLWSSKSGVGWHSILHHFQHWFDFSELHKTLALTQKLARIA
jgi:hypothetical protein